MQESLYFMPIQCIWYVLASIRQLKFANSGMYEKAIRAAIKYQKYKTTLSNYLNQKQISSLKAEVIIFKAIKKKNLRGKKDTWFEEFLKITVLVDISMNTLQIKHG